MKNYSYERTYTLWVHNNKTQWVHVNSDSQKEDKSTFPNLTGEQKNAFVGIVSFTFLTNRLNF